MPWPDTATHHPHVNVSPANYDGLRLITTWIDLPDGRCVELFVNRDTNLVVLDVVDANEKGGVEVYRMNV